MADGRSKAGGAACQSGREKENSHRRAICDATVFLGKRGLLNEVDHASNQPESLQDYAGEKYTGAARYELQQAVQGGSIVTANMEFSKELLVALHVMTPENVEQWYHYYKFGYYEAMK